MTNFCFQSEVTALDCWKSAMRRIYRSIAGIINIIFTGAMIALAVSFLDSAKVLERSIILLGCVWFPVIQPVIIYVQQRKSIKNMTKNMVLSFSEKGMQVQVEDKKEDIPWKKLDHIAIEPGMVILFSDAKHGYIVTNRSMGQEREAFLSFLKQHC